MNRAVSLALPVALALLAAAPVPLVGLLGPAAPWWGDLLAPFMPHAALAGALALAAAAALRSRALAVAALGVGGAALAQVLPLWTPSTPARLEAPVLRVLHLDVHVDNPDLEAVAAAIERADADVAVVIELSRAAEARLARLPPPWRPLVTRPAWDAFGLGVYARHAATSTRVRSLADLFPVVEAVLPWGDREVVLYAVHTIPPVDEETARANQAQHEELRRWLDAEPRPRVVVGDLDATPWSVGPRRLDASGYRSVHLGAGHLATWPTVLGPLGIIIDHVLLSQELVARAVGLVEVAGSDHRGLRVDVVPARR
jgi:endonuclease/exonuclease/phosphatase (EEP) superfamily protein YafD